MIPSHYPPRSTAPFLSYTDMLWDVWVAASPLARVRILELNVHRAITAAGITLGVSADKLRALPAATVTITEMHNDLLSSFEA